MRHHCRDERQLIEAAIQSTDQKVAHGRSKNYGTAKNVEIFLDRNGTKTLPEVIELYLVTRDARPDLYALICELEVLLHRLVLQTLKSNLGERWWRDGFPEATRKNCQIRREEDNPQDEPYYYTTLIELKSIIDGNWRIFSTALPKSLAANKQDTLQKLQRANGIRNRVMHPVKPISAYEEDFRFLRKLLADLKKEPQKPLIG